MNDMTLHEVYIATGVSRRAVQGYEKMKLVSATNRNERGYLLYDEEALERIRQIKFYQQLGFTLREIKEIIDAPNEVLKEVLIERIEKLKLQREHVETLIKKAYEIVESL